MRREQPAQQQTLEALTHAQQRRTKRLEKIEKARARLDKSIQKLRTLEDEIATLLCHNRDTRTQPPVQAALQGLTNHRMRLIFNPQSKGAREGTYPLEEVVGCLRCYGLDVGVDVKTSGRAVRGFTKAAVKRGADLVIVAAGDGTIEDVVGQLVGTKTALGIIPIGTMNNIARSWRAS